MCVLTDEEIDKTALLGLTETMIAALVPKIGQHSKLFQHLNELMVKKNVNYPFIKIKINFWHLGDTY